MAREEEPDGLPPADALADRRFVFAGNRAFVLDAMTARGLEVAVFAVRGSRLEDALRRRGASFTTIESREHLVTCLDALDFDYFVANGCPYILPVSKLKKGNRTFVNVHPGPLPDLRGVDPVPGALLLGRNSGAACHIMDDGVDTGPVISCVVIPLTDDLDAGLLYQMSFLAETDVFNAAYRRAFRPAPELNGLRPGVSYKRKAEDLRIDFNEPAARILRRIRAFSNRSQGARFAFGGREFRVFDAEMVENPWLMARREAYAPGEVVFRYEDCLLLRLGAAFLKLKAVEGDLAAIRPGDRIAVAPRPEEAAPAA